MLHEIYLIPGFFGFAQFGPIEYFQQVKELLAKAMLECGNEALISTVPTLPTASIRKRAEGVVQHISERHQVGTKIHLIGHSTGGLDARLVSSPHVLLHWEGTTFTSDVATVVTISTPHYGTPTADFFLSVAGKYLMLGLSLFLIAGLSGVPVRPYEGLASVVRFLLKSNQNLKFANSLANLLDRYLLRYYSVELQEQILAYLHQVAADQGALPQLTAEVMDLFNSLVIDNVKVKYFSYLTAAPRPSVGLVARNLLDPLFLPSYSLFYLMRTITAQAVPLYPYGAFDEELNAAALRAYGFVPKASDNDGIVPTCSQAWGEIAGMLLADHIDVCGHFSANLTSDLPSSDWLRSGSNLSRQAFEAIFRDIGYRLSALKPPPQDVKGFVSL